MIHEGGGRYIIFGGALGGWGLFRWMAWCYRCGERESNGDL